MVDMDIVNVSNEPLEYSSWASISPLAQRLDPDAFPDLKAAVIVPFPLDSDDEEGKRSRLNYPLPFHSFTAQQRTPANIQRQKVGISQTSL